MLKDQKELLAALNAHGVEYVVIDGHAAIAYGVARLTQDLHVSDPHSLFQSQHLAKS